MTCPRGLKEHIRAKLSDMPQQIRGQRVAYLRVSTNCATLGAGARPLAWVAIQLAVGRFEPVVQYGSCSVWAGHRHARPAPLVSSRARE